MADEEVEDDGTSLSHLPPEILSLVEWHASEVHNGVLVQPSTRHAACYSVYMFIRDRDASRFVAARLWRALALRPAWPVTDPHTPDELVTRQSGIFLLGVDDLDAALRRSGLELCNRLPAGGGLSFGVRVPPRALRVALGTA